MPVGGGAFAPMKAVCDPTKCSSGTKSPELTLKGEARGEDPTLRRAMHPINAPPGAFPPWAQAGLGMHAGPAQPCPSGTEEHMGKPTGAGKGRIQHTQGSHLVPPYLSNCNRAWGNTRAKRKEHSTSRLRTNGFSICPSLCICLKTLGPGQY